MGSFKVFKEDSARFVNIPLDQFRGQPNFSNNLKRSRQKLRRIFQSEQVPGKLKKKKRYLEAGL